jgi:hypothetical protein
VSEDGMVLHGNDVWTKQETDTGRRANRKPKMGGYQRDPEVGGRSPLSKVSSVGWGEVGLVTRIRVMEKEVLGAESTDQEPTR